MTPIRWGGQLQRVPDARSDPRRDRPAFFADGVRPRHHGLAVGRAESIGDGTSPPLLGQSIGWDKLHRALDA
jgi:hypothetical protein